ncbi:MAG: O-antigen ligase family protein [Cyanobacteria bacterium]|nr:O-antigen ligase family protein [Cyanobacteriota bacterium]
MTVPLKPDSSSAILPIGGEWPRWVAIALILLPYLIYGGLGILLGCLGRWCWQWPGQVWQRFHRGGFSLLTVLLLLSSGLAVYPGEALLQLFHFLPYFLLWAAIATALDHHPHPHSLSWAWAKILVLGSLPMSLWTLVEYGLKHQPANALPALLTALPPVDWLYIGDPFDPRAYGFFDSPNTLANYAVMVLGLGLGLLAVALNPPPPASASPASGRPSVAGLLLVMAGLGLTLYCCGSRNGYLAAMVLILVWVFSLKTHRWIRYGGLAALAAIAASALTFGIGGRQIAWAWVTQDPRVYVWRLALRLMADRPWLGQGLGNYKLLYDGSVPGYDTMPHAHNLWLSLMAETGIPITVGLTVAIGAILYRAVHGWSRTYLSPPERGMMVGYGLCFLAAMLFALFDLTLFDARVNVMAWLALAVLGFQGTRRRPPQETPSPPTL